MIAIDTSVVLRFLLGDDESQAQSARTLIEAGPTYVGATVLLESFWVLKSRFAYPPESAATALLAFIAIQGVVTERAEAVQSALRAVPNGLDFPDALHAALAEHCMAFATFDGNHRKRAGRMAGGPPVVAP